MTMMIRFQNGPEAPEIILEETLEEGTSASNAKRRLKELANIYGTVEEATAWVDGDDKPKHLKAAPAEIPAKSRLAELPVTAPPSPEALAAEQAEADAAAEAARVAHEEAEAANAAAVAEATAKAEAEAAAAAEAASKEAEAAAAAKGGKGDA